MSRRILIKRDTTSNWTSNNPVLLNGELGLDTTLDQLKIGDGSTAWSGLPFITVADVSTLALTSQLSSYMPSSYLDTDGTLAANSDSKVASQKAVKTYVQTYVASSGTTYTTGQIVDGDICVGLFNGDWLFMAPPNSRVMREWGGNGTDTGLPNLGNLYNLDPNTGKYNTDYLLVNHSGIFTTSTAAGYCRLGLTKVYDLPNKEELMFIHQKKNNSLIIAAENSIGGTNKLSYFTSQADGVWSSSEVSGSNAWAQNFSSGLESSYGKSNNFWTLPIRRVSI